MKKRIYILAPNDRFNYGDLIFPYILRHYLSDITDDIVFCSTTKSDLSAKGGLKTESFKVLYSLDANFDNHLIIAGGECLFAHWWVILSYVDRKAEQILFQLNRVYYHLRKYFSAINRIRDRVLDNAIRPLFNYKTKYPFSIGKYELKNISGIYYNSVGNVSLIKDKRNCSKQNHKILSEADYISVRDSKTSAFLNNLDIKHTQAPDSAILMSEVFSPDFLSSKVRADISKDFQGSKYIFFQVNLGIWSSNKESIIKQLNSILGKSDCRICLCPIGTAMGHCDDTALTEIRSLLPENRAELVSDPSLWDIMWLIRNAHLYIGTSLHGVITSLSFGVPYISFCVSKVEEYLKQWTNDTPKHFCKIEEIADYSLNLLNSGNTPDADIQKSQAIKSIQTIHDAILRL